MYNKKMLVILMLAMALCVSKVYAQWSLQHPNPTVVNLNSIQYNSYDEWIAVGDGGVTIKTTNRGQSWTNTTSGTTNNLLSLSVITALTSFASGENGTILKSINGGTSWTAQTSGVTNHLNSITFSDANNGWIVGNTAIILHTTNGGQNWTTQSNPEVGNFFSVCFVDNNNGWAVGEGGRIIATTNGGLNWSIKTSGTTNNLYSVNFKNTSVGWAAGASGKIIKTTDGGQSWTSLTSGVQVDLKSVYFKNTSDGWVTGANGTILHSGDGGNSFYSNSSGTTNNINNILAYNTFLLFAVGNMGTIAKTENGGVWNTTSALTINTLSSVSFANQNYGWAAGQNGTVIKTTNSGQTWSLLPSFATNFFFSVAFPNIDTGWVVGSSGKIFRTTNGGDNWASQYTGVSNNLKSVAFLNANTGCAVGLNGTVLITYNGGVNWSWRVPPTTTSLNSVCWANNTTLFAVGSNGKIFKSINDGQDWAAQTSGTVNDLNSVSFIYNYGWAVGSYGTIVKTMDGGETWALQTSGTSNNLTTVKFVDVFNGWAVGTNGTTLKTTNGGTTWTTISSGTQVNLWSVASAQNNAWAVGEYGHVLKYTPPAQITLTSPVGAEEWRVGASYDIEWASLSIDSIKIDYTTNNGSSWIPITASTPATTGYFTWTIPNTVSTQCKVKLTDKTNSAVGDTSDDVFSIVQPKITVIKPNGGEIWVMGTPDTIKWTSNNVESVKIERTTDNGVTWNNIRTNYPANSQKYVWNPELPAPSTQVKIRIVDVDYPTIGDTSDNYFTILGPEIHIVKPNGGENFKIGDVDTIKWTSSYTNQVLISYSTDFGNQWNVIEFLSTNTGSYVWTIPNTPSTNCRVKIERMDGFPAAADQSDTNFTISRYNLSITSPNGGENWGVGTQQNITWNSSLLSNSSKSRVQEKSNLKSEGTEAIKVKIEYTSDNGSNWLSVVDSVANAGIYNWTIPNTPSANCRVKISQVGLPEIVDSSDNVFSIVNAMVQILKPNGGENWKVGAQDTIKWTSFNVANVRLEYSTDNGNSWYQISASTPASAGSYAWVIPPTPSTNCLVKVSDASNPSIMDVSDAVFTISSTVFTVTSPNGGEVWQSGTQHNITWNSTLAMKNLKNYSDDEVLTSIEPEAVNVRLEYSTNNGTDWLLIVSSMPNNGTYNWTVPNTPSTNCKVKVSQASYSQYFGTSANVFTIFTPTVTVVKPNGGENWKIGETDSIKWNSSNVNKVKIQITTNNGTSWITLADSANAASGSFVWTIANTPSTNCKVRITDSYFPVIGDTSNSTFSISATQFTVVTPNGGESWRIGTQQNITWNSSLLEKALKNDGNINEPEAVNVKLEYSTNNGSNWIEISASTANSGNYNWTIPNTPSANCRVKVSQVGFQQIGDSSNNVFTIFNPSVTVVKPNGGENWKAGDTDTIKWISAYVANIKVEATTDNGATWTLLVASTPAAPGMQVVPIPNTPSTQCKVRITDAGDSTVTDMSDAVFTISQTQFTLSSPNGGENWLAGTQHSITWNSSLAMKSVINQKGDETYSTSGNTEAINVKLEYSTDNGSNWIEISASTANSGSYNWTVPNTPSANCRVKVSQVGFQQFSDSSNNVFTIFTPAITVTKPNGGEVWRATDTDTIKWTSNDVANVKIQYSTDNGTNWITVATSTPASAGNYVWTIPNTPSTQCKVRITSSNNSAIGDMSDSLFVITPFVSARENGSEIPTEFSLEQNFPNPFNPSTIIQYAIASRGKQFVSLKIYDVLGKEVAVLVNEEQEPGIYKVEFSTGSLGIGSGLQSGTYFYELRTNEFRLVKKLMVIK